MINKLIALASLMTCLNAVGFSQGWTKLTTTGSITSRSNASAIYIPDKNKIYVFGGSTSAGKVNELWSLDLSSNNWTLIPSKSSKLPSVRYTHVAMYDTILDRMIIWSGQGADLYNDIWAFNFNDSTWQELFADGNVSGAPLKRYGTATVFDPAKRNIINFAGFTTSGRFDDTWSFNVDSMKWMNKTNSYFPLKRCLTSQSFAADRREMIVFGGQSSGNLDDIWTMNLDTYIWTNPAPVLKPKARHYPSNVYCGKGYVVVFGGSYLGQGNIAGGMNDLWSFSLDNSKWDSVQQGSTKPAERFGHIAVYIPSTDKMIIYGGTGASLYNDTWEFSGISTAITSAKEMDDRQFSLQIYPSPGISDVKIGFTLSERLFVTLTIYDIKGGVVAIPISLPLNEGKHIIDLNNYQLVPGVYFVSLNTPKGNSVMKWTKIKE